MGRGSGKRPLHLVEKRGKPESYFWQGKGTKFCSEGRREAVWEKGVKNPVSRGLEALESCKGKRPETLQGKMQLLDRKEGICYLSGKRRLDGYEKANCRKSCGDLII